MQASRRTSPAVSRVPAEVSPTPRPLSSAGKSIVTIKVTGVPPCTGSAVGDDPSTIAQKARASTWG